MKKIIILCCLTISIWLVHFLNSWAGPIAVIVNKVNDASDLKSSNLARIYKGRMAKWPNGKKIHVIDHSFNSDIRLLFYDIVLDSKPTKKFFKPGSPIPFKKMILVSDLATKKYISRIPNAIGYIRLSEVDDTVKILMIDGKLPTDEGYNILSDTEEQITLSGP